MLASTSEDQSAVTDPADASPLASDVFPGDAAEGATTAGASASARTESTRHGWRVLATLSALMGFASISTDLYLPAMPAMGMGEMRSSFNLTWNGADYSGGGTIPAAGSWNITAEARRGGQLLAAYRSRVEAK